MGFFESSEIMFDLKVKRMMSHEGGKNEIYKR